ncbi:MAG: maleylpyruvate isomerase family mycothiol-dependent enzyme [Ilumatobacteraceae bacterium]
MDRFIESLQSSGARFSSAVRRGPLDAAVAACPGWSLADLARHMGDIHRWARLAAATGAVPDESQIDAPPADDPDELAAWIDAGVAALVPVLTGLDPDAPTWHPFPIPKLARVWPRRQAHETQVHAWDAEQAIGATSPLEPDIAFDGIAEYFEVIAPRIVRRDQRQVPVGLLGITCDDAPGRLVVRTPDPTTVELERDPSGSVRVDAQINGRAEDLLLALWKRAPLGTAPESPLAATWLDFGGN